MGPRATEKPKWSVDDGLDDIDQLLQSADKTLADYARFKDRVDPSDRESILADLTETGRLGEWEGDDAYRKQLETTTSHAELSRLYQGRYDRIGEIEAEEERRQQAKPIWERPFSSTHLTPKDLKPATVDTPGRPPLPWEPAHPAHIPPESQAKKSTRPVLPPEIAAKAQESTGFSLPDWLTGIPGQAKAQWSANCNLSRPKPGPGDRLKPWRRRLNSNPSVKAWSTPSIPLCRGSPMFRPGYCNRLGSRPNPLMKSSPSGCSTYGGKRAEELASYELGKSLKVAATKAFPTDPKRQQEFLASVLPNAMGNMLGFMAGGIGGQLVKGSATAAGLASGAVLGAGVEGAGQYEAATAAGADEETARQAYLWGLAVGTTEVLPMARLFKRVDRAMGGKATKILKNAGKSAMEESIQEWGQTVAGNKIAQEFYDENRNLLEGSGMGAAAGGTSAAIFNLMYGGLAGGRQPFRSLG